METRPLIAVFPGLANFYAVLAFNLFGDGLRDILDLTPGRKITPGWRVIPGALTLHPAPQSLA